jgi:isoprenylcysteine carboxyl methyltransferase (ICMT) family protein YpbQ
MSWVEVFIAFVISHLVGDYLLQTDWQALHKRGGLAWGTRDASRALFTHVTVYTLCFVPALIVTELGWELLWVVPAIFIPHLIQDDGRLLHTYMKQVKRLDPKENLAVSIAVDQTFHLLALLVVALLVGS